MKQKSFFPKTKSDDNYSSKGILAVLLKTNNNFLFGELEELLENKKKIIFSTSSIEEAISILDKQKIDVVVLELSSVNDIGLLEHINKYYKKTKVLLVANDNVEEFFNIIKKSKYSLLKQPGNLFEFKKLFNLF
jgi:DNA-binding NtrC family response regulator